MFYFSLWLLASLFYDTRIQFNNCTPENVRLETKTLLFHLKLFAKIKNHKLKKKTFWKWKEIMKYFSATCFEVEWCWETCTCQPLRFLTQVVYKSVYEDDCSQEFLRTHTSSVVCISSSVCGYSFPFPAPAWVSHTGINASIHHFLSSLTSFTKWWQ